MLPALPQQMPLNETLMLADHLAKSGYFDDARTAQRAVVKVLFGRELGFPPMASMTGIHIIDGKPSIGAGLMAAMIRKSGRYDYRIVAMTRERCELEFVEINDGKRQPSGPNIVTTLAEFVESGVATTSKAAPGKPPILKSNWARSPDDMLFARAISKGYRRYCPDLGCGGTVYTFEEMGDAGDPFPPAPASASATVTINQVETPAAAPPTADDLGQHVDSMLGNPPSTPATPEQLQTIAGLALQLKLGPQQMSTGLRINYGIGEVSQLTAENATDLIGKLIAKLPTAVPEAAPAATFPAGQAVA